MHATSCRQNGRAQRARFGVAMFAATFGATSLCTTAVAQSHERTEGSYTVRSTAVASTSLPAQTAKAHGIAPAAGVGVLNVSVYRSDRPMYDPLPADVHASVTDLQGMQQGIAMKPARALGDVSYYGTYRYLPGDVLTFKVSARPQGSDDRLTLGYEEKLPAY